MSHTALGLRLVCMFECLSAHVFPATSCLQAGPRYFRSRLICSFTGENDPQKTYKGLVNL